MSWLPKKNVVVPIDFSEDCKDAVNTAIEMAESPENVKLVHVLFPLDAVSPGVVFGELDDAHREEAAIEHAKKFLTDMGLPSLEIMIRIGDPGTEIADFADNVAADLVVVPSHGYHGFRRLFLGSVAEAIIRHIHCPVLVLRRHDAK